MNQEIDNIDLEIDQEDMIYPQHQPLLAPHYDIGNILIDREEDEMMLVNNAVNKEASYSSSYDDEDDESSSSNSD